MLEVRTASKSNSLPEAVRSLASLALFRKTLKMELLTRSLCRLKLENIERKTNYLEEDENFTSTVITYSVRPFGYKMPTFTVSIYNSPLLS